MVKYSSCRPRRNVVFTNCRTGRCHVCIMRDLKPLASANGPLLCETSNTDDTAHCLHVSPIFTVARTSNARHGAPDAVVVARQTAHDSSASIHPASPLHSEVHSAPPSVRALHNSQRHAVVTPTSAASGLDFRRQPSHFCLYLHCPDTVRQNQG